MARSKEASWTTTMPAPESPTFAMLEECLAFDSDEAWDQLFRSLRGILVSVFHRGNRPGGDSEAFVAWFSGWFRLYQKYLRVYDKVRSTDHPSEEARDEHTARYLWRVAETGLAEYGREIRGTSTEVLKAYVVARPPTVENDPLFPSGEDPPSLAAVEEHLAGIAQEKRVPFRLRYYVVFGMPPEEELNWVAQQCGRTPDEVRAAIEREASLHPKSTRPVSGAFVGQLLGLNRNAVHQRVRRAWLELLKRMGVAEPLSVADPLDEPDVCEA